MDFPITVPLKRKITVGEDVFEELIFDEPDLQTTIDVEEAEKDSDKTVLLLAGMASVDRAVILKIKESDFRRVSEKVIDPYQDHVNSQAGGNLGNDTQAA